MSRFGRDLPDEIKKKYPHYNTYIQCQSKAFQLGIFSLISAGAAIYVAQDVISRFSTLPYSKKSFLVPPVLGGSVVAYLLVRKRTQECQNMWMVMEEKHSFLGNTGEITIGMESKVNDSCSLTVTSGFSVEIKKLFEFFIPTFENKSATIR